LALDSENVKALCRNGEAYIFLHEIELAKQNLTKAYKLNKNDVVIKKLLRIAIDLEKQDLEKQRQLYSNFFA
jgi:CRISPR/Cas system CMR-associated protein Cmr3 (group 5 of RAMP superfamily)